MAIQLQKQIRPQLIICGHVIIHLENYEGKCEQIGEYFPSSGTGQVNMIFPV